ncbi:methyltransferase [Desulfococcaceae bacterium HSG8]|nr:methyltransferase [Desulfococcaceae bacterium HSG8]
MNPETIPPEAQMMQFILGKWISKPVNIAAKLGISDILAEGSRNIDALSEITETHPDSLYRMMRALAGVGIFTETEDRVFANTPLSECLMEGRLKSASLMFHSDWHDKMWDNLLCSIKTGDSAFEKAHGEPVFEWFGKNPEAARVFHEANSYKAAFSHRAIVEVYDFSGINTLTDVGGGFGGLMFEILEANPSVKGIIADLPETVRHLSEIIKQKKSGDRVRAAECDFFREIPGGSDACLLSHILHDWPDEACITILKNCRKALDSEGKLLIVEAVISPGNSSSVAKLLDLEVLLMGGGRERTEEEFRNLMESSGFRLSRIIHTRENVSVIEGIPG